MGEDEVKVNGRRKSEGNNIMGKDEVNGNGRRKGEENNGKR